MHLACEVAATVPSCPELFDPQHRRFGPTVCNHKQSVRDDQSSVGVCMLYKPHATGGLIVGFTSHDLGAGLRGDGHCAPEPKRYIYKNVCFLNEFGSGTL